MVSVVEDGGFLRIAQIGGWDARIIPSHALTIQTDNGTRVKGVIGTAPPHILRPEDREKPYRLDDLFVDVGVSSATEIAELGIRVGSPAVIAYPFELLGDRVVMARALDDRAGCAVLVRVLQELQGEQLDVTLVANFAVQEEVGLRGAQTAAYQIDPDIALALEGTIAADIPGIPGPRQTTRQGRGPSISLLDSSMISSPRMVRALTDVAASAGIRFQYKTPPMGGTDAGIIHRTRGGVLSGVVSLPCRYSHAPYSLLRLDDFDQAVQLVAEFTRRCPGVVGM
jgi:endoglucanase